MGRFGKIPATLKASKSAGFLTRLRGDRRGVSAVEFALIAPVMIAFYFGLAEFCQGYMAQKRSAHTASAAADLVAQSTGTVSKAELADIFGIGALILKPFTSTGLTQRISSVTRNSSGVAKVDWSQGKGISALTPKATVTTIPANMIANGESLIMAETTYDYISPIDYVMPRTTKFKSVFYLRPRRVNTVLCSDCPTS